MDVTVLRQLLGGCHSCQAVAGWMSQLSGSCWVDVTVVRQLMTVMVQEVTKDNAIPLENAEAELLMIAGEDDHNSDSVR